MAFEFDNPADYAVTFDSVLMVTASGYQYYAVFWLLWETYLLLVFVKAKPGVGASRNPVSIRGKFDG
jgi:hypothetical protein